MEIGTLLQAVRVISNKIATDFFIGSFFEVLGCLYLKEMLLNE